MLLYIGVFAFIMGVASTLSCVWLHTSLNKRRERRLTAHAELVEAQVQERLKIIAPWSYDAQVPKIKLVP